MMQIMPKKSAGLLMFRRSPDGHMQVLLVHPGGPIWAKRDLGAWTLPKGEYKESEDALEAAKREFVEETGFTDNERRRYYRITKFGSAVFSAEAARLARVMSAVRGKAVLEGARK